MTLEIQRGIPAPYRPVVGRRLDPDSMAGRLRAMEVGDSMLLPHASRNGFSTQLYRIRQSHGFDFTTRQERGGTRVWRIA